MEKTKYRKSSIALLFVLALLGCLMQGCKPRIITVDRVRTETNERVRVDSVYMSDTLYIERISHDTPCPDTVRIERIRFVEKKKDQTEAKGIIDTLRVDGGSVQRIASLKSELEQVRSQCTETKRKLIRARWWGALSFGSLLAVLYFVVRKRLQL